MYKVISNVERMNNPKLHKGVKACLCRATQRQVVDEVVEKNGRMIRQSVIKEVDPRVNFEGYKVSDFTIENLQASGAIANLKVVTTAGSPMSSVDSASEVLGAIEEINL